MEPEVIGYDEQAAAMGEDPYIYASGDPYAYDAMMSGEEAEIGADQDLQQLLAISGADDYVGYDTEVGAPIIDPYTQRRMVRPRQMVRAARMPPPQVARPAPRPMAPRPMPPPQRIVRPQPMQACGRPPRRLPLGFDSIQPVAPGETVPVNSPPQSIFEGRRLSIPSSIAGFFLIQDIKVGNKSQFVSSTAVPALAFSEQGIDENVDLDRAQVSQFITISVTNTDTAPHRFTASLLGKAWD